ncbi:60S ribosomal protein L32 [Manis javanica]|nr:60S ribosomal protein L32 [Manis javanica]
MLPSGSRKFLVHDAKEPEALLTCCESSRAETRNCKAGKGQPRGHHQSQRQAMRQRTCRDSVCAHCICVNKS